MEFVNFLVAFLSRQAGNDRASFEQAADTLPYKRILANLRSYDEARQLKLFFGISGPRTICHKFVGVGHRCDVLIGGGDSFGFSDEVANYVRRRNTEPLRRRNS